mmetsp:Transcript_14399/g.45398  ORF Transcript_14399/g.45398 Transcript_14399/m.45398 type:complete len:281 (-) Transcript_14399:293-1135(-)
MGEARRRGQDARRRGPARRDASPGQDRPRHRERIRVGGRRGSDPIDPSVGRARKEGRAATEETASASWSLRARRRRRRQVDVRGPVLRVARRGWPSRPFSRVHARAASTDSRRRREEGGTRLGRRIDRSGRGRVRGRRRGGRDDCSRRARGDVGPGWHSRRDLEQAAAEVVPRGPELLVLRSARRRDRAPLLRRRRRVDRGPSPRGRDRRRRRAAARLDARRRRRGLARRGDLRRARHSTDVARRETPARRRHALPPRPALGPARRQARRRLSIRRSLRR